MGDFESLTSYELVSKFIQSRRQGLSPETICYYQKYLTRASIVVGIDVTGQDIAHFIRSLNCSGGGKHAYFRALRTFCNYLYSPKSGYGFNSQNNPILMVDSPKREQRIMPSVNEEQLEYLISRVDNIRDKSILRLLFDSVMRLSELTNIKRDDINWDSYTITII